MLRRRENLHRPGVIAGRSIRTRIILSEGINQNSFYKWSNEFLEAGKHLLSGHTQHQVASDEGKRLRKEFDKLKPIVAELSLKNVVKLNNYYFPRILNPP